VTLQGSVRAAAGAVWGVVFWSAYGIVEYVLYSAVRLFQEPEGVFTIAHWQLSGLLFDCYWILGALSGALIAWALTPWDRPLAAGADDPYDCGRLSGSLSLLAAVVVNLALSFPLGHFAASVFAVAITAAAAILWVMRYPASRLANWVKFHPFLLALLVISPVWITTEGFDFLTVPFKVLATFGCLAAICILNWMLRRLRNWPAHIHFVSGMAVLATVVLICGFKSGDRKEPLAVRLPDQNDPGSAPVVLVSLDTTRVDHTSVGGYWRNTTPNLAAFAAGATVFPNAVAAYDMTLASHASMFTGVYPSWHGARIIAENPVPLDDRLPTLAGILRRRGYFTAGAVANTAYLTPRWGLTRGFEFYDVKSSMELLSAERPFELRQGVRAILNWFMPTTDFDVMYRRAEEVNEAAFRTLEDPKAHNRSFFLFVNYMDAHAPYLPPKPYESEYMGTNQPITFLQYRAVLGHRTRFTDQDYTKLSAQYDGGVKYEDFAFGQLMNWLKARRIYDRALIVVTADHGEALGERGGVLNHGQTVYGFELNVPLLVKYPHQTEGMVIAATASHVDILPTVLDTLGYDIPTHIQGASLRHPESLEHRQVLAESDKAETLYVDGFKLIVHTDGRRELYDIVHDRAETRDMYTSDSGRLMPMEAAFQQWIRKMPKNAASGSLDPDELRRLRSLGYLQ
jgi:arylsulfatase A-like enzyme